MNMVSVRSSAIRAVGYDPATGRMQIRFAEGHSYTFCGVPDSVHRSLMSAASKGSYYNNFIRGRYQC